MTGEYQELIYAVAVGLSVCGIMFYLGAMYADYRMQERGEDEERRVIEQRGATLLKFLKPLVAFFGHLVSSAIQRLQSNFGDDGMVGYLIRLRIRIQRVVTAAGSPGGLSGDQMLGLVCLSAIWWTGLGFVIWFLLGISLPIFVGLVVGFVHPFLWLKGRLTERRNEIRRLMPYALDLLTLSVEAGLDFTSALARLVPKLKGSALVEEFEEVLRQIRLGRSRADALRDLADRVSMPEMTAFCGSMVQADELGADLGPVLRIQSDQMRQQRSNLAEKKAMEAPVKILFPLIAFIFPTVFIILFSPMGIRYLKRIFGS
ncbi:MAG: type II secretion system F family protein [Planctomycetes bacterium]|nr:type II secretion system F family protein [Planctomycetota bacterium]